MSIAREKRLAYNREYYRQNIEKETARYKKYRQEHREERNVYNRDYRAKHKDKVRMTNRRWWLKLKTETLTHYGNGKLACVKCEESRLDCLSLDHIDGGGSKHTKGLHKPLYLYLKQNQFPNGYQTLCMNCQFIKRIENNELQR